LARSRTLPLALLLVLAAAAFAGCGGGDDSSGESTTAAAALSDCDITGKQQNLGASYVTTIQVAKVSCGQALQVVLAYHACRNRNGGPGGTCDRAVLGYNCTEGQRQSVPGVQFNATAVCKKGDAEISSSYTQNF
jgi:hypothetical protein